MSLRSVIAVAVAAMVLGAAGVLVVQSLAAPAVSTTRGAAPASAADASPAAPSPPAAAAIGESATALPWEQDEAGAAAPARPEPDVVDGTDGLALAREALAGLEASGASDPRIDIDALRRSLDTAQEMQRLAREIRALGLAPATPERRQAIRGHIERMRVLQREMHSGMQKTLQDANALRQAAQEPAA